MPGPNNPLTPGPFWPTGREFLITILLVLLVLLLIALSGCASGPSIGDIEFEQKFSAEAGPCGSDLVLRAKAGAPARQVFGSKELVLQTTGEASLHWRDACPEGDAKEPEDPQPEVPAPEESQGEDPDKPADASTPDMGLDEAGEGSGENDPPELISPDLSGVTPDGAR